MKMRPFTANYRTIKTPSQVLRKAAEYLKRNMDETSSLVNPSYSRSGACNAIAVVQNKLMESADIKWWSNDPKIKPITKTVEEAEKTFKKYFGYRKSPCNYWFGSKFTNEEQMNRIDALLLTADILDNQE